MAIVENPNTGNTRNSFGNAVFYVRNGKNIMRAKPLNYKDPETPKQLANRSKLGIVTRLVQQALPAINEAYAGIKLKNNAFNKAMSLNLKGAFTDDLPLLDHTKVRFCDTEGNTVSNVVLKTQPRQTVHVEWNPNTKNKWDLSSPLSFIVVNTSTNEVIIFRGIGVRSSGVADFTVPNTWKGCMIALHIMTSDSSKLQKGLAKIIIKFQAGVDEASVIK